MTKRELLINKIRECDDTYLQALFISFLDEKNAVESLKKICSIMNNHHNNNSIEYHSNALNYSYFDYDEKSKVVDFILKNKSIIIKYVSLDLNQNKFDLIKNYIELLNYDRKIKYLKSEFLKNIFDALYDFKKINKFNLFYFLHNFDVENFEINTKFSVKLDAFLEEEKSNFNEIIENLPAPRSGYFSSGFKNAKIDKKPKNFRK